MAKKTTKKAVDYTVLTSVEDCYKSLNIELTQIPDVSNIPEKYRAPLLAIYNKMIVFDAINGDDKPDHANHSTLKYEPWVRVNSSGVSFGTSYYVFTFAATVAGFRLCTHSSEKTLHAISILEKEMKTWYLRPKGE